MAVAVVCLRRAAVIAMAVDAGDIACLRRFYTSCPAAVADSTENWEPSAATFTDAAWEDKCSRIIGTYRKKPLSHPSLT